MHNVDHRNTHILPSLILVLLTVTRLEFLNNFSMYEMDYPNIDTILNLPSNTRPYSIDGLDYQYICWLITIQL